jgi:hypothetical protein
VGKEHNVEPTDVGRGWSVGSVGNLGVVECEGDVKLELGVHVQLLHGRCQEDRVAHDVDADAVFRGEAG